MSIITTWISTTAAELIKRPYVINIVTLSVLIVLEKLVEMDFVCPCDATFNVVNVVALFVVPPFGLFLLVLSFKQLHFCKALFFCSIPAIEWITLLFIDGQYFACATAASPGKYELIAHGNVQRQCDKITSVADSMSNTQFWYAISQVRTFMMNIMYIIIYTA